MRPHSKLKLSLPDDMDSLLVSRVPAFSPSILPSYSTLSAMYTFRGSLALGGRGKAGLSCIDMKHIYFVQE